MTNTRGAGSAPEPRARTRDAHHFVSQAIGPVAWVLGFLAFFVYAANVKPLDVLLSPGPLATASGSASGHLQTLLLLTFEHWPLVATFSAVGLIVAGRLGRGLGLPGLFRDPPALDMKEEKQRRQRPGYKFSRGNLTAFLGALGAALLIVEVWTVIYYLEIVENLPDLDLWLPPGTGDSGGVGLIAENQFSNHWDLLSFLLWSCSPFLGLLCLAELLPAVAPGTERRNRDALAEALRFALGIVVGAVAVFVMSKLGGSLHPAFETALRKVFWLAEAHLPAWRGHSLARFPLFKVEEMYPQLPGHVTIKILASFSLFVLIVLVFYQALGILSQSKTLGWPLSPGLGICMVLSFGVLFYSVLAMLSTVSQLLVVVVVLLWFVIANGGSYKYRFPGMEAYYQRAGHVTFKNLDEALDAPAGTLGLLSNERVLENWQKQTGQDRPRLILIATTGGAYRAAFWTTVVLDELGRRLGPDFHRHVRLITGASGGMVGAAYYASGFTKDGPPKDLVTDTMRDETGLDSLTPVARGLVLRDLPLGVFWPFAQARDRGIELEEAWTSLGVPFRDLGDGEEAGWRPSLVVSPMVVESGRRLLVSNLDLGALAETRSLIPATVPGATGPAAVAERLYSRSAVEFFRVFPRARATFSLQTAVRMSATFPLASPAVSLPTDPPRRVVDAGYYDNYGVDLATSWAYEHQDWIKAKTSGVALLQIRAYPSEEEVQAFFGLASVAARTVVDRFLTRLVISFQGLTSPLYGGLSAREWSMRFRNAGQVRVLDDSFNRNGDPAFFKSFVFENSTEFAMNWFLTDQDIASMRQSIGAPAEAESEGGQKSVDDPATVAVARQVVKDRNSLVFGQLQDWWGAEVPRTVP